MGEATASEEAVVGVDELRVRRVGDIDCLEAAEPLERLHLTRDGRATDAEVGGELLPAERDESRCGIRLALELLENQLVEIVRDDTRTPDGIAGRAVLAIVIGHRVLPFL